MAFKKRGGGAWSDIANVRRRSGGAWVAVANVYRRQGGAWVKVWPTTTTLTLIPNVSDYSGSFSSGSTYGPTIDVSPNNLATYTWQRDDSYSGNNTTNIGWQNVSGSTNGRSIQFVIFGAGTVGFTYRNRWRVTEPGGGSALIMVTFTRTS